MAAPETLRRLAREGGGVTYSKLRTDSRKHSCFNMASKYPCHQSAASWLISMRNKLKVIVVLRYSTRVSLISTVRISCVSPLPDYHDYVVLDDLDKRISSNSSNLDI